MTRLKSVLLAATLALVAATAAAAWLRSGVSASVTVKRPAPVPAVVAKPVSVSVGAGTSTAPVASGISIIKVPGGPGDKSAIGTPSARASRYFVMTSDPQYPWTPYDDGIAPPVKDNDAYSRFLIESQYADINRFADRHDVAATFVNGDLTAFGHGQQVDYMIGAFKRLRMPVYLGLGNHDIENNVGMCAENQCLRRSVYWFVDHMSKLPLDAFDVRFHHYYWFPTNHEEIDGSLGWSKTFGNIRFIQLNNHWQYEIDWASGYSAARGMREVIRLRSVMPFLERELQAAERAGQSAVLMMHTPFFLEDEFGQMLRRYNVSAVFAGHLHHFAGKLVNIGYGEVPVFLSGGASGHTYLVVEHVAQGNELAVYAVRQNSWATHRELVDRVPLRRMTR